MKYAPRLDEDSDNSEYKSSPSFKSYNDNSVRPGMAVNIFDATSYESFTIEQIRPGPSAMRKLFEHELKMLVLSAHPMSAIDR